MIEPAVVSRCGISSTGHTCCLLLVVTFSVRVSNIYLTGALGYYLCTLVISENATQSAMSASVINLAAAYASKSTGHTGSGLSSVLDGKHTHTHKDFDAHVAARLMIEAFIALWVAFSLVTSIHR